MLRDLRILLLAIYCFLGALSAHAESLAGRIFNRTTGQDFSFSGNTYSSYAGLTYNPLTQTYFLSENVQDKIFEIKSDGTLIRTIDIGGLKRSGIATADAEGLTWMHGITYAVALHDGKEMAVVDIGSTTTSVSRSAAAIYDISSAQGKPKGVAYLASEDALYWVEKDSPMAVVKSKINKSTGKLDTIWEKTVDELPVSNLSDITFFPRLSSFPLLISESSKTIIEVDLTGDRAVVKSSFSLSAWNIPQGSGLAFGSDDANMRVVTKHVSGQPEDEFNVFTPTASVANRSPNAKILFAGAP